LTAGVISSALVGYLAILVLLRLIQKQKFHIFGYYCLALGTGTLIYTVLS